MGWTNRQIIEQAYGSVGLSAYAFDLSPEELNHALLTLQAMLAEWSGAGYRIGYAGGGLEADSGVPDVALGAVYLNLGILLSGKAGKAVTPQVQAAAVSAKNAMAAKTAQIPRMAMDRMGTPSGAGNSRYGYTGIVTLPQEDQPLTTGNDGPLDL